MRKQLLIMAAMGLAGVASLLAVPFEAIVPASLPAWQLRPLLLIQPAILVLTLTALGCWLTPKTDLAAPYIARMAGRDVRTPHFPGWLRAVVAVAVVTGAVLFLYEQSAAARSLSAGFEGFETPLIARLLYGGIAEELITRWGLMTLIVLLLGKLSRSNAHWTHWAAAAAAALLFAAGHLPLLFAISAAPSLGLIASILAGNALPGFLFGWLFWKHGLEGAMAAHAGGHLLAYIVT